MVVLAAIGLFLLNNVILAAIVPSIPGGMATGITTIFVLALLALTTRVFGTVSIIYLISGLLGVFSQLPAGSQLELPGVFLLVFAGFTLDWVLYLNKYHIISLVIAYPLFSLLVNLFFMAYSYHVNHQPPAFDTTDFIFSLLLGYAGIILAHAIYRKWRTK